MGSGTITTATLLSPATSAREYSSPFAGLKVKSMGSSLESADNGLNEYWQKLDGEGVCFVALPIKTADVWLQFVSPWSGEEELTC
jgi:hypothetical protein